jgi:hypothetical protein
MILLSCKDRKNIASGCHDYYYSLLLISFVYMENNNNNNDSSSSCDVRIHAYKNGKTMEQCREEARKNTALLSEEISNKGEVSWTRILEMAEYDELVYKLTLKYLRQRGYDIGYNKIPRVKA